MVNRNLSDHLGVSAVLNFKNSGNKELQIPASMAKEAGYTKIVDELAAKFEFSDCVWARLEEWNGILKMAAKKFLRRISDRGAILGEERKHWAVACLRGNALNDKTLVKRSMIAAPMLCDGALPLSLPLSEVQVDKVRKVLEEVNGMLEKEKIKEYEDAEKQSLYSNGKKDPTDLPSKVAALNPKRKRKGIEKVRDQNQIPIYEKGKAQKEVARFWGKQFEEKSIDKQHWLNVICFSSQSYHKPKLVLKAINKNDSSCTQITLFCNLVKL